MNPSSRRVPDGWGRVLLVTLGLWGVVASVEAFLSADGMAAAAQWLGAWRTLFGCASIVVGARIVLLWWSADLADRDARRTERLDAAARRSREERAVPFEFTAGPRR